MFLFVLLQVAHAALLARETCHNQGEHHAVFSGGFRPWSGLVNYSGNILRDFVGCEWSTDIYCSDVYMGQPIAHPIRVCECHKMGFEFVRTGRKGYVRRLPVGGIGKNEMSYPLVGEEYFEYIDALTSVLDYRLRGETNRPYAVLECGAGFGYWGITSVVALRNIAPDADFRIQFVEMSHQMVHEIYRSLKLNDIPPEKAKVETGRLTTVKLPQGKSGAWRLHHNVTAKHTTLTNLLSSYEHIDYIDMDCQGCEFNVFTTEAMAQIQQKVTRVHIGTHELQLNFGNTAMERERAALVAKFTAFGFEVQWDFPATTVSCHHNNAAHREPFRETPFGAVCFGDGILSFRNKRFSQLSVHSPEDYTRAWKKLLGHGQVPKHRRARASGPY